MRHKPIPDIAKAERKPSRIRAELTRRFPSLDMKADLPVPRRVGRAGLAGFAMCGLHPKVFPIAIAAGHQIVQIARPGERAVGVVLFAVIAVIPGATARDHRRGQAGRDRRHQRGVRADHESARPVDRRAAAARCGRFRRFRRVARHARAIAPCSSRPERSHPRTASMRSSNDPATGQDRQFRVLGEDRREDLLGLGASVRPRHVADLAARESRPGTTPPSRCAPSTPRPLVAVTHRRSTGCCTPPS